VLSARPDPAEHYVGRPAVDTAATHPGRQQLFPEPSVHDEVFVGARMVLADLGIAVLDQQPQVAGVRGLARALRAAGSTPRRTIDIRDIRAVPAIDPAVDGWGDRLRHLRDGQPVLQREGQRGCSTAHRRRLVSRNR
jgi:hypothetical protein